MNSLAEHQKKRNVDSLCSVRHTSMGFFFSVFKTNSQSDYLLFQCTMHFLSIFLKMSTNSIKWITYPREFRWISSRFVYTWILFVDAKLNVQKFSYWQFTVNRAAAVSSDNFFFVLCFIAEGLRIIAHIRAIYWKHMQNRSIRIISSNANTYYCNDLNVIISWLQMSWFDKHTYSMFWVILFSQ